MNPQDEPSPPPASPAQPSRGTLATSLDRVQHDVEALAAEMVQLQRQAALGAVAGLLAHEVNNILTPALTHVRLARKDGASDEQVQRALAVTDDSIGRTAEIARAILALGRGGVADETPRAAVLDAARAAVAALGRDLGRDGITCEFRIDESMAVAMTPTSLQQVFVNLFQNARTAMLQERQAGRLTVEAAGMDSSPWNTGGVEIVVRDTGPGIRACDRERVFEPFMRGRGASAEPGSGLGLSVCRELITAAGGTIRLEPSSGPHDPNEAEHSADAEHEGARFVIRIPRAASIARPEARASRAGDAAA
ncbi:MAG: sensor histidine kinase [Phycisphaerales bacterium]